MFPTLNHLRQKRVKIQKSTDKHSLFDGLIQEDIDLSDIYSAVEAMAYNGAHAVICFQFVSLCLIFHQVEHIFQDS